jgi:Holliday junction resolvasome RuvABC DNA-binding subunit
MRQKRETARTARSARAARGTAAETAAEAQPLDPGDEDVLRALQTLGYRAGESRRALELCADMPGASREDKLRRALTYFPQRCHRVATFTALPAVPTPAPA